MHLYCCASYVVLSNIIFYFLSGDDTLTELLEGKSIYISVITKLELRSYHDLSVKESLKIEKFLSECTVVELNSFVQTEAVNIRRQYKLKLPDSIIVATALYLDLPLISSDKLPNTLKEGSILYYEKK